MGGEPKKNVSSLGKCFGLIFFSSSLRPILFKLSMKVEVPRGSIVDFFFFLIFWTLKYGLKCTLETLGQL